jgi:hypothetical protein
LQQELVEIALEIEAELAGAEYVATPDEVAAIDERLAGEVGSGEEVKAGLRRVPAGMRLEYSKRDISGSR